MLNKFAPLNRYIKLIIKVRIYFYIVLSLISIWTVSVAQTTSESASRHFKNDSVGIMYSDSLLQSFYAKSLNADGIVIRSARVVDDQALIIAAGKIKMMLARVPKVTANLVMSKVELHIIGKNQNTSDLPEYQNEKGIAYQDNGMETNIDKRTRGLGGPTMASCGEENLLRLPQDKYAGGYDICIHEFAHTLMASGLDDNIRKKIRSRFNNALATGLWKNSYAATNAEEYWAELSTWYFGFHGDYVRNNAFRTNLSASGAHWLKEYDKEGYKLLDSIYSGLIEPRLLTGKPSMIVSAGVPSVASALKATFLVINKQAHAIPVYWIDYKGKAVYKRTIAAGSSVNMETYQSSVWLLNYDEGKSIYMQVNEEQCKLEFK